VSAIALEVTWGLSPSWIGAADAAATSWTDPKLSWPEMAHGGHETHRHMHVPANADSRRLVVALVLIVALMIGEVAAGILADSLVLLSDAAHMLTDAGAIALSLVALRLARRPAQGNLTFGFRRAEVLSAQANGATLLVLAGLIGFEAIQRLLHPVDVAGGVVMAVALVGAAVNVLVVWQLSRADRDNMAVEGSFQHVLTDLYAFAGTLVAGGVIVATGFTRADPIASLLVCALMLRSAWGLLRASSRVLLEAAPEGVDVAAIGVALAADPRVSDVHDLHVWEIGTGFPALSAHVIVRRGDDCHATRRDLERVLAHQFGIEHTTLQVEHEAQSRLLTIGRIARRTQAK
jgi:cobalt-zinc-cadmium efflux system protein